MRDLNALAGRVHLANQRWWVDLQTGEPLQRNVGELFMLVVSEFAEAMEGHRRSLPDDKLPHRSMFEVELADALIRLFDIAGGFGVKLVYDAYRHTFNGNVGFDLLTLCRYCVVLQTAPILDLSFAATLSGLINRIYAFGKYHHLDLDEALEEKMAYNAKRVDHTREARLAADGKKD